MKIHNIPEPLLEAVLERYLESRRGSVKRWRRWSMYDVATVYYYCNARYHLKTIAKACETVSDRAKVYCESHSFDKNEATFIEAIYTDIEIHNMKVK